MSLSRELTSNHPEDEQEKNMEATNVALRSLVHLWRCLDLITRTWTELSSAI